MGPRTGSDGFRWEKISCPYRDSDPVPFSPWQDGTPATLLRLSWSHVIRNLIIWTFGIIPWVAGLLWSPGTGVHKFSKRYLQILDARRVTSSKFDTEDPQIWNDLWTSLLSVAFCSVRVNWYTFLHVGSTLQKLVAQATRSPGFVHTWLDIPKRTEHFENCRFSVITEEVTDWAPCNRL